VQKKTIILAGFSGAMCVLFGAMGAHALRKLIPADNLFTFETAVRYQFYHTLALLFVGVLSINIQSKLLSYASYLFILGIVLFSFSLYFLALRPLLGIGNEEFKWIGAITPLGGVSFALAWLMLSISIIKTNNK